MDSHYRERGPGFSGWLRSPLTRDHFSHVIYRADGAPGLVWVFQQPARGLWKSVLILLVLVPPRTPASTPATTLQSKPSL